MNKPFLVAFDTKELQKALFVIKRVAERKATMPILGHVQIGLDAKGTGKLFATDLEAFVTFGSLKPFVASTTVNACDLERVVKEVTLSTTVIEVLAKDKLLVDGCELNTVSEEEMPHAPKQIEAEKITSVPLALYDALQYVAPAMSKDETRYNIVGVFIDDCEGKADFAKGKVSVVATDGHRASVVTGINFDFGNMILPKEPLEKMLSTKIKFPEARLRDGLLTFCNEHASFAMRLVDGKFPDYRQVVPSSANLTVRQLKHSEMTKGVKKALSVATDKSKTMRVDITSDSIILSASSPERGKASYSFKYLEARGGKIPSFGVSAKYINDYLNNNKNEDVTMDLVSDVGPIKLRGEKSDRFTIVMPMRFE